MAVTPTALRCPELHSRLPSVGASQVTGTHVLAALRQLHHFWPEAGRSACPGSEGIGQPCSRWPRSGAVWGNRDHLNALATELDWLKAA